MISLERLLQQSKYRSSLVTQPEDPKQMHLCCCLPVTCRTALRVCKCSSSHVEKQYGTPACPSPSILYNIGEEVM